MEGSWGVCGRGRGQGLEAIGGQWVDGSDSQMKLHESFTVHFAPLDDALCLVWGMFEPFFLTERAI